MNISVALCTFNGEAFLEEQLVSIARQSRVPDEIVLLDDRSTDSTVEIAKAVCSREGLSAEIQINAERLGVGQNFSHALQNAKGDILFLCDQDDVWEPGKVEKMVTPIENDNTVSLVYSDGYIVDANLRPSGKTLFSWNPEKKLEDGDRRDIVTCLRLGKSPGIKGSAMAFPAWMRDLAGPVPEGVAHDSWMALFGYAAGRVVAIHEPLHFYRRHDKTFGRSTTNKDFTEKKQAHQASQTQLLAERAVLAQCFYTRLVQISPHEQGKTRSSHRFELLKVASQEAARTLNVRAQIVGSRGMVSRMFQAGSALLRGDYLALPERHARLKVCCRDIGLSTLKQNILQYFKT